VADFSIVSVRDPNTQKKVWDQSRPAPKTLVQRILYRMESVLPFGKTLLSSSSSSSSKPSLPAYILFQQGSSYESASGLRYQGGDDKDNDKDGAVTVDILSSFLATWLQRQKLGNYVYSLGVYDLIAAQTMSLVHGHGKDHWMPQLWVHGVGRLTRYLVQPTSLPFEKDLVQQYEKCALKVLQEGPKVTLAQVERLERLLEDSSSSSSSPASSISPLQREQLSQRLYIWKRFDDPVSISPSDFNTFLMRLVLNLLSVVGIAILIPFVLFGGTEEQAEEEAVDEDKEPTNDDSASKGGELKETGIDELPTHGEEEEHTASEPNPKSLSKKEQLAIAQAKAKALMTEDKDKVEAVKAARKAASAGGGNDSSSTLPLHTDSSLQAKTVVDLKEMLKTQGLPVSGKKQELVDRVLAAQAAAKTQ
jgi:hypothetical protein